MKVMQERKISTLQGSAGIDLPSIIIVNIK